MTISMVDIAWATGFLEGEGCFIKGMVINATQNELQTLEKLKRIFGGKIHGKKGLKISYWLVSGGRAAGVMMTIYTLMSNRRQEAIRTALIEWKSKKISWVKGSNFCAKGHDITLPNSLTRQGPNRYSCSVCRKQHWKKYRDKRNTRMREREIDLEEFI